MLSRAGIACALLLLSSIAHGQGFSVNQVNCNRPVVFLSGQQNSYDLAITAENPEVLLDNQSLTNLLNASMQRAIELCRERARANWIVIHVSGFGQELVTGNISAAKRQWTFENDRRSWVIPGEVQKIAAAQQLREAAAREPPSATSQQDFCKNFARNRTNLAGIVLQAQSERNPLRAQQLRDALANATRAAASELTELYGTGLKRFENYEGLVGTLNDAGFGRISLTITGVCDRSAPITFDVLFSNEKISDPPDRNDPFLSSLPQHRSVLAQINKGDRIKISGLFRHFQIGTMSLLSIGITDPEVRMRVRVTDLQKQ